MLVRGMVDDKLGDHAQAATVGFAQKPPNVPERTVGGMNVAVVGNIIAFVFQRRGAKRQEPDRRYTEIADVIELLGQAGEVANAIAIAVLESADMNFIDDGVLVPERVILELRLFPGPRVRSSQAMVSWHAVRLPPGRQATAAAASSTCAMPWSGTLSHSGRLLSSEPTS